MDEELKTIKDNYYLIKKSYCKNYYQNNKAKILLYQEEYNKKKKQKKFKCEINYTKQIIDF